MLRSVEACSHASPRSRSTGSIRARSGSRCTFARGSRRSRSSGWPTPRSASPAIGSTRRSSTPGFEFPTSRITANLAPAFLRKVGPGFDAALALGVLAASGQIPSEALASYAVFGELSLSGELRDSPGALVVAEGAARAGLTRLIVPRERAREAALVDGLVVAGVTSLRAAADVVVGARPPALPDAPAPPGTGPAEPDLADVRGHATPVLALQIAAAGGHNLLLEGPPGTGKTMLARRLPSILPAHDPCGGDRGDADPQRRRPARRRADLAAAVPRPAPHDLAGGTRRRRLAAPAGGGHARAPRRAVPRRAVGVPALDDRRTAPAARGRQRDDRPRTARAGVPDRVHAGGGDEPVPLRVCRGGRPLHLRRDRDPSAPAQAQRAAAGPHGPAGQRRASHRGRPALRPGDVVRSCPRAGRRCP